MDARQAGGREVLLVQGAWVSGRAPSRKTKDASKAFMKKHGGTIAKSIEDAKVACRRLVELAEIHGSNLRVWGCGGGMDQLVQISTPTGFIEPVDHMRPLNSRSTVNRDKQVNTRPATVTLTHRR